MRAAGALAAGLVALVPAAGAEAAVGPTGELTTVDCVGIAGWAHDPDMPRAIIDVHLYFGGPAGDPAASAIAITADQMLPAGCDPAQCPHGFQSALPMSLLDEADHVVHAYGIDLTGDPNLELPSSPLSFSCPPPPIVGGEKRHVASPEALAAWQFSTFFDLLVVDDVLLAGLPEAGPIDAGPVLAVSDDGDPTVWWIDGQFRRPVAPEHAAAWRFDLAAATVMPAAMLEAMPQGAALRPRPILAQGSGPAVYLLDDHNCLEGDPDPACAPEPPDPGGTGGDDTGNDDASGTSSGGGETDAGSDSDSGSGVGGDSGATDAIATSGLMPPDPRADGDEAGCGCRSRGAGGTWAVWGVVAVFGLRARRR